MGPHLRQKPLGYRSEAKAGLSWRTRRQTAWQISKWVGNHLFVQHRSLIKKQINPGQHPLPRPLKLMTLMPLSCP